MQATLTVLLKFILCSGILTAFYYLMFRNKSSFLSSRIFLLAIPVISIILSVVTIPIPESWFPGSAPAILADVGAGYFDKETPAAISESGASSVAVFKGQPRPVKQIILKALPLALLVLYAVVALLYQLVIMMHLRRIRHIRANANKQKCSGYTIYRSNDIESPFSVMKSIYISTKCSNAKYFLVVIHEGEHIRHRHYVDMLLIEAMTVIFWFNPVIWLIRRELRSVHEFQADDSILRNGIDRKLYMMTILEEAAGSIPVMANGFNNSLIKKRFMKMKNGNHIRHRVTRSLLSVCLVATLMVIFSCHASANDQTVTPSTHAKRLAALDWSDHRTVNLTFADGKYYTPDGKEQCWCEDCQKRAKEFKTKYLSHDDVVIVTGYESSRKPSRLVSIDANKKETRVTFVVEIYWDSNWLHRSAGTYLLDPKTGDKYMIRDIAGGQEVGRMNVVNGLKGQFVEQTMIFPPLKKGVKVIDIFEPDNYEDEALPDNGTNAGGDRIKGIHIADYPPVKKGKVIL